MTEGWYNDDYLVLFDGEEEAERMTEGYGLRELLPGYTAVGLKGWDDLIVRDQEKRHFTIPTVPLDPSYLQAVKLPDDQSAIRPDARFEKKVKWYITPIVFGGDPKVGKNLAWISYEQHFEAVRYWNKRYRDLAPKVANREDAG